MRKDIIIDGKTTNYEISDDGKIFNKKTGRELKGTYKTNEYHTVMLMIDKQSKIFLVHRLIAQAFIDNPNNYPIVDHINQNKYDNRIENLRWVDYSTNSQNVLRNKPRKIGYWYEGFDEHWKQLLINTDYYISDSGIVVNSKNNKILSQGTRNGYKRVLINGKLFSVHRLVWEAFNGEIPDKIQVDHINGNKADNRLENLRLVSNSENMKNAYANGHSAAVKIYQFDEEGTAIAEYPSIKDAARAINGNECAIKDASNRFGMSSGYYWLREQDKDKINDIIVSWVPEGFKIIPSLPTYCINEEGQVYNKRNKRLTPIHYFADGTHPYIKKKGVHYQIQDLLEQTWKKN